MPYNLSDPLGLLPTCTVTVSEGDVNKTHYHISVSSYYNIAALSEASKSDGSPADYVWQESCQHLNRDSVN